MMNRRILISGLVTSTQRVSQKVHRRTIEHLNNANNEERDGRSSKQ